MGLEQAEYGSWFLFFFLFFPQPAITTMVFVFFFFIWTYLAAVGKTSLLQRLVLCDVYSSRLGSHTVLPRSLAEVTGFHLAFLYDWCSVCCSFSRSPYLLCVQELWGRRETVLAAALWEILP